MKKILFLILTMVIALSIYLHWSYARIYNRDESTLNAMLWPKQISLRNSNFQNSVKYAALGDSLTHGLGSDDIKNTLAYIFALKLSKNMSVSFANLSISGATTDSLIKDQLGKAIKESPNYVTLFIGINDIHSFTPTAKFQENMNYIIRNLISKTSAKIVVFNIPYLGDQNLILPPYNIIFDYYTQRYNKIIAEICSEKNVMMIDLYTPTKERLANQRGFYSTDQFHPSEIGYQLWGQLLTEKNL